MIPLELCFENDFFADNKSSALYIINHELGVIIFLIDIILKFNTGFYEYGYIILQRNLIIKKYFHTDFFLNFLAIIPYSFIQLRSEIHES